MIIATTQFSLKPVREASEFWERVDALSKAAAKAGAKAILFPEYFSLSLQLCGTKKPFRETILSQIGSEAAFISEIVKTSNRHDIAIIAGTYAVSDGRQIFNRCYIARPGEKLLAQDKLNMTRFESEEWLISPGAPSLSTFTLGGLKAAVAICYDVEFPAYCRQAAEELVDVLFVPSCTDDERGYWRVRHCAEARAVENQCFVIMSSIVEGDASIPEISAHYGAGIIQSPCDIGFPPNGLLAQGKINAEDVTIATLDVVNLQNIRKNGTVLNLRDQNINREK